MYKLYEDFEDGNILVPVSKENSYYVCHLPTKNHTRRYTRNTLPPFLITKIINIDVTESQHDMIFTNVTDLQNRLVYLSKHIDIKIVDGKTGHSLNEKLELGFKIPNGWYIVPLSKKEYNSLLGKDSDTRKKSKDKSKEHIR
tara:strand:- start:146 stop:571 length:426 start_codon:yes stop_codon:yes gene_type:complete